MEKPEVDWEIIEIEADKHNKQAERYLENERNMQCRKQEQ